MAPYIYIGQEFVGKKLLAPWGGQKENKNDAGGSQSPHTLFMHLVTSFLASNPQLLKGLHFPAKNMNKETELPSFTTPLQHLTTQDKESCVEREERKKTLCK